MILYHVTRLSNLPSILREGLLTSLSKDGYVYLSKLSRVYSRVRWISQRERLRAKELVVLTVHVSERKVKPTSKACGKGGFRTAANIETDAIIAWWSPSKLDEIPEWLQTYLPGLG